MTDRRPVYDAPHGSPEAGVVKVYRVCSNVLCDPMRMFGLSLSGPHKHLVREEDPFDSDLQAGTTLPGGPGHSWASGADPRIEERGRHDPDEYGDTPELDD